MWSSVGGQHFIFCYHDALAKTGHNANRLAATGCGRCNARRFSLEAQVSPTRPQHDVAFSEGGFDIASLARGEGKAVAWAAPAAKQPCLTLRPLLLPQLHCRRHPCLPRRHGA